jgi:hypothetical protein
VARRRVDAVSREASGQSHRIPLEGHPRALCQSARWRLHGQAGFVNTTLLTGHQGSTLTDLCKLRFPSKGYRNLDADCALSSSRFLFSAKRFYDIDSRSPRGRYQRCQNC